MNRQCQIGYCTADAKKEFDRWSRIYDYDPLQFLFFHPSHRMLLDMLGAEDERILDVGCGTGQFAARVLERFPQTHVWGLDLSQGMLHRAEVRCQASDGRLHLLEGDSENLPFLDDSFDVVTCSHSFHHYPHQDQVLAEMHRVLRPGGRLLIIDGDRDRPWGWLIFDVIVVLMEGPVRHLTSRAFRKLYQETGFGNLIQRRRKGPLPFLMTVGEAVKPAQAPATLRVE